VLVEHEQPVQRANGRRSEIGQMSAGECPVLDAALTRRQPFGGDWFELEHVAHGDEPGRESRNAAFFGRGELHRVSIDLRAARYEVRERFGRRGFDRLMHLDDGGTVER
jgi:hypothetical protein